MYKPLLTNASMNSRSMIWLSGNCWTIQYGSWSNTEVISSGTFSNPGITKVTWKCQFKPNYVHYLLQFLIQNQNSTLNIFSLSLICKHWSTYNVKLFLTLVTVVYSRLYIILNSLENNNCSQGLALCYDINNTYRGRLGAGGVIIRNEKPVPVISRV